jgi:hypothetical protein
MMMQKPFATSTQSTRVGTPREAVAIELLRFETPHLPPQRQWLVSSRFHTGLGGIESIRFGGKLPGRAEPRPQFVSHRVRHMVLVKPETRHHSPMKRDRGRRDDEAVPT